MLEKLKTSLVFAYVYWWTYGVVIKCCKRYYSKIKVLVIDYRGRILFM